MNLKPHPTGFWAEFLERCRADTVSIMQEYEAKKQPDPYEDLDEQDLRDIALKPETGE